MHSFNQVNKNWSESNPFLIPASSSTTPLPVLLHLPYMEPQNTCSWPIQTQRDTWLLPLQLMALPWVTGWWPAPSPALWWGDFPPHLLRIQQNYAAAAFTARQRHTVWWRNQNLDVLTISSLISNNSVYSERSWDRFGSLGAVSANQDSCCVL